MNLRRITLLCALFFLVGAFISTSVLAVEFDVDDFIDPNMPDGWYEAPKTASELEITEFNQSPILDDDVEEGAIPPVSERLPEDPAVVEPYEEIGQYGGTHNLWEVNDVIDTEVNYHNRRVVSAGHPTPRGDYVPYYIKDWEYSDNAKKITLYLREGLKWSDGELVTAEDYLFWWNHIANNKELTPTPPEEWDPGLLDVTSEDKWTVTYHYAEPNPTVHEEFVHVMGPGMDNDNLPPAHYMKQFHPDFVEEEDLDKLCEEVGLDTWTDYFNRVLIDSPDHPEYENQRPVLSPYIVVSRGVTTAELERNPYFPFVDPEGNQLPYIDKIRSNLANETEMALTKAATGEATFAFKYTQHASDQIPLLMNNQEKEDYTVKICYAFTTHDVYPNLSHKDSEIQEIFQDERFRKALSLAIDREDINQRVFFGKAQPMQSTCSPIEPFFKEEWATAYVEYDPEKAREYLDDIGMVDVDDDGFRETPDGNKFNPTLMYSDDFSAISTFELIDQTWSEIGINVNFRLVDTGLKFNTWGANDGDLGCWVVNDIGSFAPLWNNLDSGMPAYTAYYETDGEEGIEPPEEYKQLYEWARGAVTTTEEEKSNELKTKVYEAQAEKLYRIGIIGMFPRPGIAVNSLKNVFENAMVGWSVDDIRVGHPEQFFFAE